MLKKAIKEIRLDKSLGGDIRGEIIKQWDFCFQKLANCTINIKLAESFQTHWNFGYFSSP